MQLIIRKFINGLLAFLPIFITVYAVYHIGGWLNEITNDLLKLVIPGIVDVPGLGIAIGVLAIFVLGLLVSSRLTRWIYNLVETPLRHVPIIKELYVALKQLTEFLSPGKKDKSNQVVSVHHPDYNIALIGLLMREQTNDIGFRDLSDDRVAVYLPMSYQIGGFTVFVPRTWIAKVDLPVETALRETLTGWMQK
jgi:uncharacterized membrane protein